MAQKLERKKKHSLGNQRDKSTRKTGMKLLIQHREKQKTYISTRQRGNIRFCDAWLYVLSTIKAVNTSQVTDCCSVLLLVVLKIA